MSVSAKTAAAALSLLLTLSACQSAGLSGGQVGGGLIGAAAGGLIGSQFGKGEGKLAATAGGAILGLLVGSELGAALTPADQRRATASANQAFEYQPSGYSTSWRNPDSGNSGSWTPGPVASNRGGQPCREYTSTIIVDGRAEEARGVACRNPDGSWRVAS